MEDKGRGQRAIWKRAYAPAGGIAPKLSDAELVAMAVIQALLMVRSERRWVRYLRKHLLGLFPYQLKQAGYNKRLRAALPLFKHCIRALAADTDSGSTITGSWTRHLWNAADPGPR